MTKKMLIGFPGSTIFVLAAALTAPAVEEKAGPGGSQTRVVLVGIGNYADKQIKPRLHAEDDAKALYDLFTNKEILGVGGKHVRLLMGTPDAKRPSERATRDNIIKALHWAVSGSGPRDLIVFAFLGQGAPLDEGTCYFASDSTFKDRAVNAVAAADIEHEVEKLQKTANLCAFIDVNFRGFDPGKDPVPDANRANFFKEFFASDEKGYRPSGRAVFLATDGMAPSLDLEKHGLFTQVLLDGLQGKADMEGYEPDGVVTVNELSEYLNKEIPALIRIHGKTKEERLLSHFILGGQSSRLALTYNPAATAKVQERLDKLARLAQENKISKELADEGQSLLRQMPKLEAYRTLRKKYQQLVDGNLSKDDFAKERTTIHDGMKLKRSAALAFAAKVIQAAEIIHKSYVKEIKQHELVVWAIQGLYEGIDSEMPNDIMDGLDRAKDKSEQDLTELAANARERLGNREDLANDKDLDISLQQMTSHLDSGSAYIDPATKRQFGQDPTTHFSGIGVQIRKDIDRDMLLVVTPIRGSPAYNARPTNVEVGKAVAGLRAGDVITQITREVDRDGNRLEKPEIVSTRGLSLSDAVLKISGKAGTTIKLIVEREGFDKPLEFEITRVPIKLETVVGVKRNEDDSWDFALDPQKGIYYIRLNSFSNDTHKDLYRFMKDLSKKGVKGLILDLRFNRGGLLSSAVSVADMFIDDGLIVAVRDRAGNVEPYLGQHEGSYLKFPMVCLVNGGTTDVSEIVAACLQDHNRALIVGERSAGKGSYQHVQPFEGGELKITIASFWRPSGKSLSRLKSSKEDDEWGIVPHKGFLVKLTASERDKLYEYQHEQEIIQRRDRHAKEQKSEFEDRQLEKSLDYLRGLIKTAARPSGMR